MEIFDKQELFTVMNSYNPWWNGMSFIADSTRKRLVFDELYQWVVTPPTKRAILISGARQVGKTTIIMQVINALIKSGVDPETILYVTFDHPIFKAFGIEKTIAAFEEFKIKPNNHGKPPEYIFIDEIQYADNWQVYLKHQVDFYSFRRMVVTGSALPLYEKGTESGVGRWHTIKLPTLSFYEFLGLKAIDTAFMYGIKSINELEELSKVQLVDYALKAKKLLPYFNEYLIKGGFPELINAEPFAAQKLAREDVIDKVLKRDLSESFGIRNVFEVEKLFSYLCLNDGGIFELSTVAGNLEFGSKLSITKYIEVLKAANLIYCLKSFGMSKEILKGKPKIYLSDPVLVNSILLNGDSLLGDRVRFGKAVENVCFKHVYSKFYSLTPDFYYWQDNKTRLEVDIIVSTGNNLLAFEIKNSSNKVNVSDVKGMLTLCKKSSVAKAYIITGNESDIGFMDIPDITPKIFKIPAHIACYLLGMAS